METGKAIIFCAPSGSGKTTIVKHLLKVNPILMFSISACTRSKRPGEIHGQDYYFLTQEEFKNHISNQDFMEYEEVYGGNFYGTLHAEVYRIWQLGKVVLFDVDVEGGLNLKNHFGKNALAVFVKPPNVKILEERLTARSTETNEMLKLRLEKAVSELKFEEKFEKVLLNDTLEIALAEAEKLTSDFINS